MGVTRSVPSKNEHSKAPLPACEQRQSGNALPVLFRYPAAAATSGPNNRLQPTPSSLRYAAASRRG
jgi:hypothetical protein